MSWTAWLIVFIIIQIVHGLGTWKIYKAAGRQAWEAFAPIYNAVILMKIINRPIWWTILLFLPVVNLIMFIVVWVEILRSFRYNRLIDTILGVVTLGFYIYYINYTQPLNYKEDRSLTPESTAGEWTSSILFAVVAATIVHTYVMQPFIIPTPSLEKTLMTGDFLFVSKFHYGPRFPMTTVAAPMVHDTIPVMGVKSYLARPQLPYLRLPGFTDVERNDIVVFNYPTDTINSFPYNDGEYHYKPIDKKSNYVKRCVGIPGDTLSIIDGKVHINGKPLELPDRAKIQYSYVAEMSGGQFSRDELIEEYDITDEVQQGKDPQTGEPAIYFSAASQEALSKLEQNGRIKQATRFDYDENITRGGLRLGKYFPYTGLEMNGYDNMSPFLIPAAGMTVDITARNIAYFRRIIEVYEGSEMDTFNRVDLQGNDVLLNGKPLTSYTFKQNYYWLMGDNRHNSEDSRVWGYVPETHVVGKPVFVWMSVNQNRSFPDSIRWERLFTTVNGSGTPQSYLVYFLVVLIAYFVGMKIYKRRKAKKK
ncbi:signal peptidase I [Nonlabens ponticola]|uniref:Signal peptidase I n=1 Tax=Nonlabens ponticola TaxID=2496866 RepID=A0A3S9MYN4_9FLAO|nr:signal peptidase I [Nonlabens ponticola]AZQ44267.1 signal peptidase I [Nonlabens ponticola]